MSEPEGLEGSKRDDGAGSERVGVPDGGDDCEWVS